MASLQPTVLTGTRHSFGKGRSALGVWYGVNNRSSSRELPYYCNFDKEGRLCNVANWFTDINCVDSPMSNSQGDLGNTLVITVDCNGVLIARRAIGVSLTYLLMNLITIVE